MRSPTSSAWPKAQRTGPTRPPRRCSTTSRFYDGTTFHRVIPEFMIQGGDPTGTGMGDPGYSFDDEFDPNLNFDRPGRLAMANSGPNTNGSQFFITEQAYDSLNQHYTIFGQCDDASVAVVKTIARVQRDCRRQAADAGGAEEGDHRSRRRNRCRRRRTAAPSFQLSAVHACCNDSQSRTT